MRIGLGQIAILGILLILFFGRFPKVTDDLTKGLQNLKQSFRHTTTTSSKEKTKPE